MPMLAMPTKAMNSQKEKTSLILLQQFLNNNPKFILAIGKLKINAMKLKMRHSILIILWCLLTIVPVCFCLFGQSALKIRQKRLVVPNCTLQKIQVFFLHAVFHWWCHVSLSICQRTVKGIVAQCKSAMLSLSSRAGPPCPSVQCS